MRIFGWFKRKISAREIGGMFARNNKESILRMASHVLDNWPRSRPSLKAVEIKKEAYILLFSINVHIATLAGLSGNILQAFSDGYGGFLLEHEKELANEIFDTHIDQNVLGDYTNREDLHGALEVFAKAGREWADYSIQRSRVYMELLEDSWDLLLTQGDNTGLFKVAKEFLRMFGIDESEGGLIILKIGLDIGLEQTVAMRFHDELKKKKYTLIV